MDLVKTLIGRRRLLSLTAGAALAPAAAQAQLVSNLAYDLENGEFNWFPERSPGGPILIIVSIPDQLLHVFRNGIPPRHRFHHHGRSLLMTTRHALAALAATCAFGLLATPALANPPKFTASCPTGITVKSNGNGKVKINGAKATVKTFSASAWEARANGVSIDFGFDGDSLTVTYTAKGGANGICQVTSGGAASSGSSGNLALAPSKDQQACLAAVSNQTNNGEVEVLDTNSSEANNTVIVGVGKDKAKWKCLVKNGRVGEVMSLTDEGAL